jgi:hypothetical protein
MKPKDFFGELKRRNVYEVAAAYAVMGWLIIQVATQVFRTKSTRIASTAASGSQQLGGV